MAGTDAGTAIKPSSKPFSGCTSGPKMAYMLRSGVFAVDSTMKVFAMRILRTDLPAARRVQAMAVGVTLSALVSSAAWAQLLPGAPPGAGDIATGARQRNSPTAQPAPQPAPEAIPGAKAREPAAPATKVTADMQPTDALFDAINRGDIAGARDALNRGADLDGVNILGMTPMELSVDLGRNDISFLLLSMRGEDSDRGARALGHDAPPKMANSKTTAGKATASGRSSGSAKAVAARGAPAANTIIPPRQVVTPKLFANDGGTPLPSAGFLGFDSRSASN